MCITKDVTTHLMDEGFFRPQELDNIPTSTCTTRPSRVFTPTTNYPCSGRTLGPDSIVDATSKEADWFVQYFIILSLGCQAVNYCKAA